MSTTQQPADLPSFAVEPSDLRRWSSGHTVAAATVAVGVLLSGGVALAARDSSATPATT